MTEEETTSFWIKSEPGDDGQYHVYLEVGPDDVVPLTAETAYGWAREVLSAVAQAEYDAAVMRQMKAIGIAPEDAGWVVKEIRKDRAEHVPLSLIPGLAMVPGVSAFTGKGFLRLMRHGKTLGQWDMGDARQHALAVIEAFEVAPLDSAYVRALAKFGIEPGRAANVISGLGDFRD